MEEILNEIREERLKQNAKWGEQNHNPLEWIAIIGEEFGEASREAVDAHFMNDVKTPEGGTRPMKYSDLLAVMEDYRKELIQLAAVTVQAIESFDRNENL